MIAWRFLGLNLVVGVLLVGAGCSEDKPVAFDGDLTTAQETESANIPVPAPQAVSESSSNDAAQSDAGADGAPSDENVLADSIPVEELTIVAFAVPAGSRPHDVAPAADGGVWYIAASW